MDSNVILFDEVFEDFIRSNLYRERHVSFFELLMSSNDRIVKYENRGFPYLASVKLINGHEHTWLHISLRNKWFGLGQKVKSLALPLSLSLERMESTRAILKPYYKSARALYQPLEDKQVLVVKAYPKEQALPALMVTLEHGIPFEEEAIDAFPL